MRGETMTNEERLEKMKKCLEMGEIMRNYQNAYFKNRLTSDLQKAKSYERVFDRALQEILHGRAEPVKQETFL